MMQPPACKKRGKLNMIDTCRRWKIKLNGNSAVAAPLPATSGPQVHAEVAVLVDSALLFVYLFVNSSSTVFVI